MTRRRSRLFRGCVSVTALLELKHAGEKQASARLYVLQTLIVAMHMHADSDRAARLITGHHCGGKPLMLCKCGAQRTIAVCAGCGLHHRINKLSG